MHIKKWTLSDWIRYSTVAVCFVFSLVSLVICSVQMASGKEWSTVYTCALCAVGCFAPEIGQKLMKFRISTPVYIGILLYIITPIFGHSFEFYTRVVGWDKFMHTTGGVVFAMVGAYLPKLITKKDDCSVLVCILCAFCFSITISVLWEIYEYISDTFFGLDMQKDTYLSVFNSYFLGDSQHSIDSTGNITSVIIQTENGAIELSKYIDIGLHDTMLDIIVESLGAAVYCIAYAIDKGKYTAFRYMPNLGKTPKTQPKNDEPTTLA